MRTSASVERPIVRPPKRSNRSPGLEAAALEHDQRGVGAGSRPPGPTGWKPVASGAGAVVARTSLSALRATQSRNR